MYGRMREKERERERERERKSENERERKRVHAAWIIARHCRDPVLLRRREVKLRSRA